MASADETRAIALLDHLTILCDEARRTSIGDPMRIGDTLSTFEETLAMLAPVLERVGTAPMTSRDAVRAAAEQAANSHASLMDAMALELERLRRALAESDQASTAAHAYGHAMPSASGSTLSVFG